ncbi:MAG TPA: type II toxin-antitoxin system HicB family antitoxin [Ktedonobacterales bacterium]|nr:type II toxin-antitoxin system HicB family antitoxin [Ktedonobacterales bacterium]
MTDQQEDATYDAYLLRYPDGSWLALASDLPGAYAAGASPDEAAARLAVAIPAYYAWLRQHDDYMPITHDTPHVVVRGQAQAGEGPAGWLGAFFAGDAEPVGGEDLDWWLAVLDWAYDDLLAEAQSAPLTALRASLLDAVAQMQAGIVALATGGTLLALIGADDALGRVSAVRAAALAALRRANAEQRTAVREAEGQRWSLRRGLRASALLVRRATDALTAIHH